MFNNYSEIIPEVGLGGCRIRMPLREIQPELMGLGLYRKGRFEMASIFESSYILDEFSIRISVDTRNGKIFKLCALPGYGGTLFSSIKVGMLAGDAMLVNENLYYDEMEEIILIKDCPGVAIDVGGGDPPPHIVPGLHINAICVVAPEAFTAEGNKGFW